MEALCRVVDGDLAKIENARLEGLDAKDYNIVKVFRSDGDRQVSLVFLLKAWPTCLSLQQSQVICNLCHPVDDTIHADISAVGNDDMSRLVHMTSTIHRENLERVVGLNLVSTN